MERFADGHADLAERSAAEAGVKEVSAELSRARIGRWFEFEKEAFVIAAMLILLDNRVGNFAWAGYRVEQFAPGEHARQADLLRDVVGNPFHPVVFFRRWRSPTAVALARRIYDDRDFAAMPLLADALQDAGCEVPTVLGHCRSGGEHVRGCWVVDGVLGKD